MKHKRAWIVFEDCKDQYDRLILYSTRQEMFDWYGVNSLKEWKDNVGYKFAKVNMVFLTKKFKS